MPSPKFELEMSGSRSKSRAYRVCGYSGFGLRTAHRPEGPLMEDQFPGVLGLFSRRPGERGPRTWTIPERSVAGHFAHRMRENSGFCTFGGRVPRDRPLFKADDHLLKRGVDRS